MYSKIFVPLDGSTLSECILPYASKLAKGLSLPLELFHAIGPDEIEALTDPKHGRHADIVESDLKNYISAYLQWISATIPSSVSVQFSLEKGKPADLIVDRAAADPDSVVAMATRGMSGVKRWFVGSVANKTLQATKNPLLLVKGGEENKAGQKPALTRVLVPLDGSRLAETALPRAVAIAKALQLPIETLRCFSLPITAVAPAGYPPYPEIIRGDSVRQDAENYLKNKVDSLKAEGVSEASYVVAGGEAGNEIIETARQAPGTLVVMCTHGRTGVSRWLLGSVADRVVHHSGDPVILVRPPAEAR